MQKILVFDSRTLDTCYSFQAHRREVIHYFISVLFNPKLFKQPVAVKWHPNRTHHYTSLTESICNDGRLLPIEKKLLTKMKALLLLQPCLFPNNYTGDIVI